MYSYQYTTDSLTVVNNKTGAPFHVQGSESKFKAILEALKQGQWNKVTVLIDEIAAIRRFSGGKIRVSGNVVTFNGEVLHPVLTRRLLALAEAGVNLARFENFLTKLRQNPSYAAQNELMDFLQGNSLVIAEDGDFFAYKAVRSDYRDIHSGRFTNTPGSVHSMPRHEVDDDRHRTCSRGFHFASLDYALNFGNSGSRIVSLKINPADVVAIPIDYNNQKGRTWQYTVVADITDEVRKGNDPLSQYQDSDVDPNAYNTYNNDDQDSWGVDYTIDDDGDRHYYDDSEDDWFYDEGYRWNEFAGRWM